MSSSVIRAAIVVFIASFCTLVIEIVAGRVLAPYVGVSLYTWTSIIGVVLAGISGGAYAGGWLADRRPSPSTLGWLLLASGITSLVIGPATNLLAGGGGLLTDLGLATTLLSRVVALSFLLFFLPSFFLGMISPVAVKLAVRDLATAGSVVGKIYAFSTLGSIAGTFMTGFYLVAHFGTRTTLVGVGVVLIATALLAGGLFERFGQAAALALLAGGAAYAGLWPGTLPPPQRDTLRLQSFAPGVIHSEESQYYLIAVERTVRDDTGAPIHALNLDHLVHSYADLDDPAHLEYEYLRIFNDVAGTMLRTRESPRFLFIGGGGYTLPRLLLRTGARIDVVEIDPAVTRVAHRFFGLPRHPALRTFNQDARWFALQRNGGAGEQYDAIFIDAFNDLSVPYHLTTREYSAMLLRMLKPGGAIVVNLIDSYEHGRFLRSYIKTLQSLFGEEHVALVAEAEEDLELERSTYVVVASTSRFSYTDAYPLPEDVLRRWMYRDKAIVLTDDYAPVDNMLAPLFTGRFADELQEE